MPVPDPEERNEDGTPVVHWVTMTRAELQEAEALEAAIVERTRLAEELAQQAVRARDLHRLDVRGPAATRSGGSKVQVPSVRTVVDPAAVELIGDGLPVIRGVSIVTHTDTHTHTHTHGLPVIRGVSILTHTYTRHTHTHTHT